MTPHLRTFIDAIESAAGKRDADKLTSLEKFSLCICNGIKFSIQSSYVSMDHDGQDIEALTHHPVEFIHDGGNWQVIELK